MSKTNNTVCMFLKNAIIGLIFMVPFADLIISSSLYFPFITGKGFAARALIVLIALLYTALVIRDKSYLPKKTTIVWATSAFMLVLLAATITSVNPWRSLWSNQERMEGFATLLEMFVLFIAATGVFSNDFARKSKEKNITTASPSDFGVWKWFLNTVLALSVIMGLYALSQQKDANDRIFGTLGNSSYLGGYALVHIFLAMYLLINLLRRGSYIARGAFNKISDGGSELVYAILLTIYYIAIALFNVFIMFRTGTRGSFAGLLVGLCIMAFIWAVGERKYPLFRWIGIIFIAAVVAVVLFLGVNKNAPFVKNSLQLNRFASLISFDYMKVLGDQGYSRTMLWKMAAKGVAEKPVLGWGQDNFPYVFAKYYDPAMYAQEAWFDRTHNVFFDWLIAAGFLGLIAYLSLFATALYTLWRRNNDDWSITERSVITGMLFAYFVHNIFVFDNLASYIFFFTLLAFINSRGQGDRNLEHKPLIAGDSAYIIDVVAVVVFGYVMWISVLSPYNSSAKLIGAMQDQQQTLVDGKVQTVSTDPKLRFALIKSVIGANDLTRSEARERLVDISVSIITQVSKTDPNFAKEVYLYTVDQYHQEFASSKTDPRPYFFYSIFLQKLGINDGALVQIKKASDLSPTKQSFLFSEGQLLLSLNKKDEAVADFEKAYGLDKTDIEALKYYVYSLIEDNRLKDVDAILLAQNKITPEFKADQIWRDTVTMQALVDAKDFDKALSIAKQAVVDSPTDVQAEISLSAIYLKSGDKYSAIAELKKIKVLQPSYAADVDKYISDIQAGKDPTAQSAGN